MHLFILSENGLTFIYILDKVVGFIYNNSRYYDSETCRFISPDVISIIDEKSNTINGLNLYMYCNDNPVMMVDPSGHMPKLLRDVLDIGLYVVSAIAAVTVSALLIVNHVNPKVAVAAGIATFGALNNLTNAIHYNCFSDEENGASFTSSSYTEGEYVNRWDRLDYTKAQTKEKNYNLNAWRYFSEYNLHMWGWYASGWAYEKNIPVFSWIASKTVDADLDTEEWDERWYVKLGRFIAGLLGI